MKKITILLLLFGFNLAMATADNIQVYQAAKKAFSVGLYSIALENFTQYLDGDIIDKKIEALYLSGIASYYLKKYSNSVTYLESISKEYPNSGYADKSAYWIGLNYYFMGEYTDALKWFIYKTENGSSYIDISYLYTALVQIQLNKKQDAIISLNKLMDYPESLTRYKEEALYRLSDLYMENEDYTQVINSLNYLIFDYHDTKYYKEALFLLSETYFIIKEWESAERSYLLLKEIQEENSLIYKRLATISFNLDHIDKCKEYLEYYNNNFDIDKNVMFMLADIYASNNNYNSAIELYSLISSSIKLTTKESDENNYRLGTLYYKIDDFKKAYDFFLKVNNKDSIYFSILSGLKSELNVLEQIKKLNNNYYNDEYCFDIINRYINYLELHKLISELDSFLGYITELYPENLTYSLTYGEFLLERNELESSLKYLGKGYYDESPYYYNISYKIGWIYYNKKEYSRAIGFFNKIPDTDDNYNKALYSKSISNYKLGDLYKGREGFLQLLKLDTIYKEEVSYYLGLIEKENHNYKEAIKYFRISMNKDSFYLDSLENIGWSYYYLEEYEMALDIYLDLGNKFNAANCYFNLKQYDKSLVLYEEIIKSDSELISSAYYKYCEILFLLKRYDEAVIWIKNFYMKFPDSELPGDIIITNADNNLYGGKLDLAIDLYNKILDIFYSDKVWIKARFRLGEAFYLNNDIYKSVGFYLDSIVEDDVYSSQSVKNIVEMISELSNPEISINIKNLFDNKINPINSTIVPVYTEFIREGIISNDILKDIDNLITISDNRTDINELQFFKAQYYYRISDLNNSQSILNSLVSRSDINIDLAIEALMLLSRILEDEEQDKQAIDLYLKIYINFPNKKEESSHALFNALLLNRTVGDKDMEYKILNILKAEYSDTSWGQSSIN